MKKIISLIAIGFLTGSAAFASAIQPSEESFSRALQQAKRVASLENDQDIPSRAIALSQRVAKNSHSLAFQAKKPELKPGNKKTSTPQ